MKKTISLTENDIRRMVMEAMDELDWKTYANAAKLAKGRQFRSFDFADKAAKEFNKKHKLGDENEISDGEWSMFTDGLSGNDVLNSIPWEPDVYDDVDDNKYLKTYHPGDLPINLSHIDKTTPKQIKYIDIEWYEDYVDEDSGKVTKIKRTDKIPSECLNDKECIQDLPSNYTITGEHYENENDDEISHYKWNPYGGYNRFSPRDVDKPDYHYIGSDMGGQHLKSLKNSTILNKSLKQNHGANKDFNDYLYGNTKYVKGKGWINRNDKLEEAITRAIRKYLK